MKATKKRWLIGAAIVLMTVLLALGCAQDQTDQGPGGAGESGRVFQPADRDDIAVDLIGKHQIEIRLYPQNMTWGEVEQAGEVFTTVHYAEGAAYGEFGAPAIPYMARSFAVPVGATVRVHVQEAAAEVIDDVLLMPLQPPVPDSVDSDPQFIWDESAYNQNAFAPQDLAHLGRQGVLRGVRFNQVWATNFRYNAALRQLKIYDEVRIRIVFEGGEDAFFDDLTLLSDAFVPIYRNALVNAAVLENPESKGAPDPVDGDGADLLIITDPAFAAAAGTLRNWKVERGLRTEVRTTAETGTSPAQIQAYVQNAYDTWNPPPAWLLFLGDAEHIPPKYVTKHPYSEYGSNCYTATDLYYATTDGSDYVPDILIGRIPVDTAAQANAFAARLVAYESDPPTSPGFYTNTVHAAFFQDYNDYNGYADRRFLLTTEEFYQYFTNLRPDLGYTATRIYVTDDNVTPRYWAQSGYNWFASWWTGTLGLSTLNIPSELLRSSGYPWDGDQADISSAVNAGTFLLTHRDHGAPWGWGDPQYGYWNVQGLANGSLLPAVFSINCETGWFDTETDDSYSCRESETYPNFAESWLRNAGGGAMGVVAATRISYSNVNDRFFWGMIDALYPDYVPQYGGSTGEYRMGDVLVNGKVYLASIYGYGSSYTKLAFEEFHWFGDPSTPLWTAQPQNLSVSHASTMGPGSSQFVVNVTQNGALVSLVQNSELLGTAVASGGSATVTFPALGSTNPVRVTVTLHNYRPYQSDVSITQGQDPFITVTSPQNGDQWPVGTQQTATWDMNNPSGWYVRASLFKGGAWTGRHLCESLPADATSCTYTVEQDLTPGSDYTVQVYFIGHGYLYQDFSGTFSIVNSEQPFVEVTAPINGDEWAVGTQQTATWEMNNPSGWLLRASLFKGGAWTGRHLCDYMPADSTSCAYTVEQDLTVGSDYTVQVYFIGHGYLYQDFSGTFSIVNSGQPFVEVTSPQNGDQWAIGSEQTATWEMNNPNGWLLRASLFKGGAWTGRHLCDYMPADSTSCAYTVEQDLTVGSDYTVQVYFIGHGYLYQDFSGTFSIVNSGEPFIHALTPVEGGNWPLGSQQTATWEMNNPSGWNVRASLFKGGAWTGRHLCESLPADATSCSYTVEEDLPPGDDYTVQVYFIGHGYLYQDFSGTFSIINPDEPYVTVTSPVQGDQWAIGSVQTATWEMNNPSGWLFRASLFKNGSWTGRHLCESLPADATSCAYTVEQDLAPGSDYAVQVYFIGHGYLYQDFSDLFAVVP